MNKNIYRNFTHGRNNWKWLKSLWTGERINKLWFIHTVERYSAIKGLPNRFMLNLHDLQDTSGWMREASRKKVHSLQFHTYEVLQEAKVIYGGKKS